MNLDRLYLYHFRNYEEMSKKSADMILEQVNEKPDSILGLATGSTPVGMYPKMGVSPVSSDVCKKAKVVIDIIFNPLKTKLLEDACSDYHGLFMLVGQAIESERIWLNSNLDIDISFIVDKVIEEKRL